MTNPTVAIPQDQRFQSGELEYVYRFRAPKGETPREPVDVTLPAPSAQDIVTVLTTHAESDSKLGKVQQLIMEAVHGVVIAAGKVKVDANLEFNQETVANVADDLSIYTIANLPRSERSQITNSDLAAFGAAYKEHAAAILNVEQRAVDNLAGIISTLASFRRSLTQEGMADAIQARLAAFVEGLDESILLDHFATYEYLNARIEDTKQVNVDPDMI